MVRNNFSPKKVGVTGPANHWTKTFIRLIWRNQINMKLVFWEIARLSNKIGPRRSYFSDRDNIKVVNRRSNLLTTTYACRKHTENSMKK